MLYRILFVALFGGAVVACGGEGGSTPEQEMGQSAPDQASGADLGGEDMSSAADLMQREDMPDSSTQQDLGEQDSGEEMGEADMSQEEEAVPLGDREAMFRFLSERRYGNYAVEPEIHQSSGPHGGRVLTFVNRPLEDSLARGQMSHPIGAASVKELYRQSDEVEGWAVSVKVSDEGTAQDWHWYYLLSTAPGTAPSQDGRGVGLCAGCHGGGVDYLLTFGPFERR